MDTESQNFFHCKHNSPTVSHRRANDLPILHLDSFCSLRQNHILFVPNLQLQCISCFSRSSNKPVFRIRIHLIHFRLNTDPDPDQIRIQGFDEQN
jgi:hypothetical protein